jgi:hypothetical protein
VFEGKQRKSSASNYAEKLSKEYDLPRYDFDFYGMDLTDMYTKIRNKVVGVVEVKPLPPELEFFEKWKEFYNEVRDINRLVSDIAEYYPNKMTSRDEEKLFKGLKKVTKELMNITLDIV